MLGILLQCRCPWLQITDAPRRQDSHVAVGTAGSCKEDQPQESCFTRCLEQSCFLGAARFSFPVDRGFRRDELDTLPGAKDVPGGLIPQKVWCDAGLDQ